MRQMSMFEKYTCAINGESLKNKGDLRWGQIYFNVLADFDIDLANEIRGTELDPFYLLDWQVTQGQARAFFNHVSDKWEGK